MYRVCMFALFLLTASISANAKAKEVTYVFAGASGSGFLRYDTASPPIQVVEDIHENGRDIYGRFPGVTEVAYQGELTGITSSEIEVWDQLHISNSPWGNDVGPIDYIHFTYGAAELNLGVVLVNLDGTAVDRVDILPTSLDEIRWPRSAYLDGVDVIKRALPKDIIKASIPEPRIEIDNTIVAEFKPEIEGVKVHPRLLAHAAGYDRFEYINTIVYMPPSFPTVYDKSGNALSVPFFDPPAGGFLTASGGRIADNQPFYWDGEDFPSSDPDFNRKTWENSEKFLFQDQPKFDALLFQDLGDSVAFITELVGVRENETWQPLGGFAWTSNYNGLWGGIDLSSLPSGPIPGANGGVTIVDPSLTLSEIPQSILDLWTSQGAVFDIPEPSSVIVFAVCCVLLSTTRTPSR